MVCVTALPCKIWITILPYVSTCLLPLVITNTKICTLDTIHVTKRYNADYGTLLKCCPYGHKRFVAA